MKGRHNNHLHTTYLSTIYIHTLFFLTPYLSIAFCVCAVFSLFFFLSVLHKNSKIVDIIMSTIINEISFNVIRRKVQLKLFLFFMNREHTIEYLHARTFKRITPQIN